MVDFRRWITAFAVLALFVGLAGAQVPGGVGGNGPLTCTASVAVPPALRAEGLTELIGDIVLTCTGGVVPGPDGTAIPTANITVSLGTNVTSRLLGSGGISEALLLIDEPGAALASPAGDGFGPKAQQKLCSSATIGAGPGGCTQVVKTVNGLPVAVANVGDTSAGPNVFRGLVSGNQVTFQGVPVLAPVSSGVARVFRITNVRANINGLGGPINGTGQVLASISLSGSTSLPVSNPVLIAGFTQTGLSTSLRKADNSDALPSPAPILQQCTSMTSLGSGGVAILRFSEGFGTAFKTRVAPTTAYNGQASTPVQNTPGAIYNSESGFVFPDAQGNGWTAGLADYGTRLKAVFSNIPSTVSVYVSLTNVANVSTADTAAPTSSPSYSPYAVLVNGETGQDANGFAPALTSTNSITQAVGKTNLYQLPVSGGVATAVWEVINANPSQTERFEFGVWIQYTAAPASNTPPPGTMKVNMSFAPISTGTSASGSLTVPRFADTSSAKDVLSIAICQTLLLYPYVTNVSGFDTGIAIANTSTDPITTGAQSGTCKLTFYDGTGKTPAVDLKVTDFANATATNGNSGTVYANLLSSLAPGFTGYMFALCNFQYAHGFAFISDLGARNLAMGYLALVVNNGSVARSNAPAAESLAH